MSTRSRTLLGGALVALVFVACGNNGTGGTGGQAAVGGAGGTFISPCQALDTAMRACCDSLISDPAVRLQCEGIADEVLNQDPQACADAFKHYTCGGGSGGYGGAGGGGDCGYTGDPCSSDADCCYDTCDPQTNQCGGGSACGDTGAACLYDSDCCYDPCDPQTNQCGGTTSDPCADLSDCSYCADTTTCQTCCGDANPAGRDKLTLLFAADCACNAGAPCQTACADSSAICSNPNAIASSDCLTCLGGLALSSSCKQAVIAACNNNTGCAAVLGCMQGCP